MTLDRAVLVADPRRGMDWCRAYCEQIDEWLRTLVDDASRATGAASDAGIALVAIGGYGRGDLCPHSDLDVMLVHRKGAAVSELAEQIWYPVWDAGLHLGHSVSTVDQAMELAGDDLDTATSLLSARLIAGDASLAGQLRDAAHRQWTGQAKKWLTQLSIRVQERHASGHEVAFALEPDLKDGRGGLRDIQSLRWADAARDVILDADRDLLASAYDLLIDARVALHRHTGRAANVLVLEDRAAIAQAMGLEDDDVLMQQLAEAGRAVAWRSDDVWRRLAISLRGPLGRLGRRTRSLGGGVELRNGEVHLRDEALQAPDAVLRVAVAAAGEGASLSREALTMLATSAPPIETWDEPARARLVELLAAGRRAVTTIEALDQVGVWTRCVLPEWAGVRARPQHNPYHRFTVDRHLLETVAAASRLLAAVDRPDLLLVAALLHDLGKGRPGDHTEVGEQLAAGIGARLGFAAEDVDTLVALVRHHLLLGDVATRRDLDDPTTAQRVAELLGSIELVRLLAALTEADGRATGPAAWTGWRAELVTSLAKQVEEVLEPGDAPARRRVVSLDHLDTTTDRIEVLDGVLTVVADDRRGAFSRVAGALALHGLEVRSATALSTPGGRALSEFVADDPMGRVPSWTRVVADVQRALDGRLALDARLAERAHRYRRSRPVAGGVDVSFDDDASADATVIDVHAADAIGVLYRITRALAELDLDIRSAKVQTVGDRVVDAFYVLDRQGNKLDDEGFRGEVVRAIRHALGG